MVYGQRIAVLIDTYVDLLIASRDSGSKSGGISTSLLNVSAEGQERLWCGGEMDAEEVAATNRFFFKGETLVGAWQCCTSSWNGCRHGAAIRHKLGDIERWTTSSSNGLSR